MKILVPNGITLLGAFGAVLSIVWASGHPYWACYALIGAALCDMIDGRVARLLGAQSRFGEQLDSLVDVIAFGVAPAWLAFRWKLEVLDSVWGVPLGALPVFAFVACSAVRLARFNSMAEQDDTSFEGIPTPVAALLIVTAIMAWHETGAGLFAAPGFLVGLLLTSAVLMVAPVRFRSFKHFRSRAARWSYFASIGGGLMLLVLQLPGGAVLFGLLSLYVLQGLGSAGAARFSRQTAS